MSDWETYKKTMQVPDTLWSAAKGNDLALLTRLLDAGAEIDARDHRGFSALMLATYAGHAEAVELLLSRGADPDSSDLAGNTVLMGATFKGYAALVGRLLAAGADCRARNHAGVDALGYAQTFGRTELVEPLRVALGAGSLAR